MFLLLAVQYLLCYPFAMLIDWLYMTDIPTNIFSPLNHDHHPSVGLRNCLGSAESAILWSARHLHFAILITTQEQLGVSCTTVDALGCYGTAEGNSFILIVRNYGRQSVLATTTYCRCLQPWLASTTAKHLIMSYPPHRTFPQPTILYSCPESHFPSV